MLKHASEIKGVEIISGRVAELARLIECYEGIRGYVDLHMHRGEKGIKELIIYILERGYRVFIKTRYDGSISTIRVVWDYNPHDTIGFREVKMPASRINLRNARFEQVDGRDKIDQLDRYFDSLLDQLNRMFD